jgi:excisionase family DNA binding protein
MARLVTVEELAQYLRIHRRTVYRLLKRKDLPAVKVGHEWRFDLEVIDKWLDNQNKTRFPILIIDDDPMITSLLRKILEGLGYIVLSAKTPEEALESAARWNPGLIFLDLVLPNMDVAELLGRVRQIQPTVPITIMTGYPDSVIMARALEHGPFAVMMKPFSEAEITAVVNQTKMEKSVSR